METKKRTVYLEVMRIIASLAVVFMHTGGDGYTLFAQYSPDRIKYWIYLFMSVFCKFPIPVFFAISGILLLPKKESIKEIWKKRISRMFLVLILFSFASYMWDVFEKKGTFSLKEFFRSVYSSQWNYAYWYLYAYLGFLICLPFLRALVQRLEKKEYFYLLGIVSVVTGILPIVEFFISPQLTWNRNLQVEWLATDIFVYPLIGYFLQYKLKDYPEKKALIQVWGLNIVGIIASVIMTHYGLVNNRLENNQYFFECFSLINCCAVFLSVKYIMTQCKIPKMIEKLCMFLGKYTFGIYLIHPLLRWQMLDSINFCRFFVVKCGIDYMPAGILYALIIWGMSLLIVMILKSIPGTKKML